MRHALKYIFSAGLFGLCLAASSCAEDVGLGEQLKDIYHFGGGPKLLVLADPPDLTITGSLPPRKEATASRSFRTEESDTVPLAEFENFLLYHEGTVRPVDVSEDAPFKPYVVDAIAAKGMLCYISQAKTGLWADGYLPAYFYIKCRDRGLSALLARFSSFYYSENVARSKVHFARNLVIPDTNTIAWVERSVARVTPTVVVGSLLTGETMDFPMTTDEIPRIETVGGRLYVLHSTGISWLDGTELRKLTSSPGMISASTSNGTDTIYFAQDDGILSSFSAISKQSTTIGKLAGKGMFYSILYSRGALYWNRDSSTGIFRMLL